MRCSRNRLCCRGCMQLEAAQWVAVSEVELRPFALHLITSNNQAASQFTSFLILTFTMFDVSLLQFKVQDVQVLLSHALFGD